MPLNILEAASSVVKRKGISKLFLSVNGVLTNPG
jgi:hypothetical protein